MYRTLPKELKQQRQRKRLKERERMVGPSRRFSNFSVQWVRLRAHFAAAYGLNAVDLGSMSAIGIFRQLGGAEKSL
jgi:hypothetical protein